MDSITVYCGSNRGARSEYVAAARDLGSEIAARGIRLVYGGTHVGTMGVMADAALARGGEVVGVVPQHIADRGLAHAGLTELIVTNDMHERKKRMADLGGAMIALPGGFGTLEEFLEAVTWNQLGLHRKACGLLNVLGFYDHLARFLETAVAEGFVPEQHFRAIVICGSPAEMLDRLMEPPRDFVGKWMSP